MCNIDMVLYVFILFVYKLYIYDILMIQNYIKWITF